MIDQRGKIGTSLFLRAVLLTLAGSFIYATHAGVRNNYGIMLGSIVSGSGLSFASVSFILAVGQMVFGLVQPLFGILAAKRGSIWALGSGVVLSVAGMVLTPLCKSAATLMLCLGVILPAGSGAISYGIIMGTITPRIAPKAVSTVSGVINASSGVGNTVLSPVINALIRSGGLLYCMLILTVPVILTWPAALLMGKGKETPPSEDKAMPSAETAQVNIRQLFQRAMRSRAYWFLTLGFLTCGFHMALITNHLPTQIGSFGFSAEAASYAFSIYGITTIAGSVLSGGLCGRLRMKNVLAFYYGLRPLTILLFLLAPKTLFTVTLFTGLFGFSGAATVPPVCGLIGREFGARSLATLYGFVFFVHQIGGFFGAWLGGLCFDVTGSYTIIWSASLALSALAAALSFAIKEKRACTA